MIENIGNSISLKKIIITGLEYPRLFLNQGHLSVKTKFYLWSQVTRKDSDLLVVLFNPSVDDKHRYCYMLPKSLVDCTAVDGALDNSPGIYATPGEECLTIGKTSRALRN